MSWREQAKFGIISAEQFYIGEGNGLLGTNITQGLEYLSNSNVLAHLADIEAGTPLLPYIQNLDILTPEGDPNAPHPSPQDFVMRNSGTDPGDVTRYLYISGTSLSGNMGGLVVQQEVSPGSPGPAAPVFYSLIGLDSDGVPLDPIQFYYRLYASMVVNSFDFQGTENVMGKVSAETYSLGYGTTVVMWDEFGSQTSGLPLEAYAMSGGIFVLKNPNAAPITINYDPFTPYQQRFQWEEKGTGANCIHYWKIAAGSDTLAIKLVGEFDTWDNVNNVVTFPATGGSLVFIPILGSSWGGLNTCLIIAAQGATFSFDGGA